jgi:hypothetical protein
VAAETGVPLLLARWEINRVKVDVALARLTNRPFGSPVSFAEWYAERGKETRAAWVLAGFREAGLAISDLAADDAVPVLLRALADERDHLRWNAFRARRERTGLSIGRDAITTHFPKPHELKAAVARRHCHFARGARATSRGRAVRRRG